MDLDFFKKKLKIDCDSLSLKFFEENLFQRINISSNISLPNFEAIKQRIEETDRTFANVSNQDYMNEIIAVRFEIFALAWFRTFGEKNAIRNSVFSKAFLMKEDRKDIWENSINYNKAVADAAIYSKSSMHSIERGHLSFVNRMRVSLFNDYIDKGYDSECVARVINRYFKEVASHKGITYQLLINTFCSRLNCELNEQAKLQMISSFRGYYNEAVQYLSTFKINKEMKKQGMPITCRKISTK